MLVTGIEPFNFTENGYEYAFAGLRMEFCRNSLGLLVGGDSTSITQNPLVSFGMLLNPSEFFGILWNPLEFFGILWNPLESFGILWNPLESFGILWNPLEPFFLAFFDIFTLI